MCLLVCGRQPSSWFGSLKLGFGAHHPLNMELSNCQSPIEYYRRICRRCRIFFCLSFFRSESQKLDGPQCRSVMRLARIWKSSLYLPDFQWPSFYVCNASNGSATADFGMGTTFTRPMNLCNTPITQCFLLLPRRRLEMVVPPS